MLYAILMYFQYHVDCIARHYLLVFPIDSHSTQEHSQSFNTDAV